MRFKLKFFYSFFVGNIMLSIRKFEENTKTFYFQIILVHRRIMHVRNVSILDKLPTKYKILSYIVITKREEKSLNVPI